jgi:hypothetical protein
VISRNLLHKGKAAMTFSQVLVTQAAWEIARFSVTTPDYLAFTPDY